MNLDEEYKLFVLRNTPLYSNSEILERIDGLIDLMYSDDKTIEYQSYAMKIILFEIFSNANLRHREVLDKYT